MTEVISIARIEREAQEAVRRGQSLDHSCPYPWHSDAGRRFKLAYFHAREAMTCPARNSDEVAA